MFQLTRPARVATRRQSNRRAIRIVSTHATRTGRDHSVLRSNSLGYCFNSRDPHGSRQLSRAAITRRTSFNSRDPHGSRPPKTTNTRRVLAFQLTRPARVATTWGSAGCSTAVVSTHATRTGRDLASYKFTPFINSFNSRDPHGSRHTSRSIWTGFMSFQLTRPARVATILSRTS